MIVQLFNPLPMALFHYQRETVATFERCGLTTTVRVPKRGTDAREFNRATRTLSHLAAVASARRSKAPTLVVWPSFGWLEPLVWVRARTHAFIVVHDPVSIKQQYGEGRFAKGLARLIGDRGHVTFVCHTDEAADATQQVLGLRRRPAVALHPVVGSDSVGSAPAEERIVLAAGQYKPTRDVDLLGDLGPVLREHGFSPVLLGRGWPAIPGWTAISKFVSEEEFDGRLSSASAVIVPYRRYWQSGVAVRALENEVPVVGRRTAFLEQLYGTEYSGLVDDPGETGDWLKAIVATADDSFDGGAARRDFRSRVDASWLGLFRGAV